MTVQTLDLNLNTADEKSDDSANCFWKRQFAQVSTRKQRTFDWLFGVMFPLICVAADPIVFRSWGPNGPLFGSYRPFAYLLSIASIVSMAAWLLWGPKLKWLAAPLSGLFFFGGSISLLVGIILLPFSLIGLLFYLIGLLGLTPLLSAVVFLRNGGRAYRASSISIGDEAAWRAAFLAGLFSFVAPYVVNVQISGAVNRIAAGDVTTIQRETTKLKLVSPLVDVGKISNLYHRFDDIERMSPRARELANAYKEISGSDIEDGPHEWD